MGLATRAGHGAGRAPVSLVKVTALAEHRDIKMTMRYAHLAPSHLRAGFKPWSIGVSVNRRNAGYPQSRWSQVIFWKTRKSWCPQRDLMAFATPIQAGKFPFME
jgi:hypothetical protein